MDSPIQLIFQQPNHGRLLPVDRLLPHVETEYSFSLSRGLERYFLQKSSGNIIIAKSRPEGDSRLLVSIVLLDGYRSPMIEISAKFGSKLCFVRNCSSSFESEKSEIQSIIESASADPDEIEHSISHRIHPQALFYTTTLAVDPLTPSVAIFLKTADTKICPIGYWQEQDSNIVQ